MLARLLPQASGGGEPGPADKADSGSHLTETLALRIQAMDAGQRITYGKP